MEAKAIRNRVARPARDLSSVARSNSVVAHQPVVYRAVVGRRAAVRVAIRRHAEAAMPTNNNSRRKASTNRRLANDHFKVKRVATRVDLLQQAVAGSVHREARVKGEPVREARVASLVGPKLRNAKRSATNVSSDWTVADSVAIKVSDD